MPKKFPNPSSNDGGEPDRRHPIWQVHDLRRTARLNKKYYGRRLDAHRQRVLSMDVLTAISASSTLGTLLVSTPGELLLTSLAGVAAVLTAVRPFLGFESRAAKYAKVLRDYNLLEHDLEHLLTEIELAGEYRQEHKNRFLEVNQSSRVLREEDDPVEARPHERTRVACFREVLDELPVERLYVPSSSPDELPQGSALRVRAEAEPAPAAEVTTDGVVGKKGASD